MTTTILQNGGPRSATVYQFPLGGRAAITDLHAQAATVAAELLPRVCGSAWYHDEAIQEATSGSVHDSKWTGEH